MGGWGMGGWGGQGLPPRLLNEGGGGGGGESGGAQDFHFDSHTTPEL